MVRIYTEITNLPTFQSEIGQPCFYEKLSQKQLMDAQIGTLKGHNILQRAVRNFKIHKFVVFFLQKTKQGLLALSYVSH